MKTAFSFCSLLTFGLSMSAYADINPAVCPEGQIKDERGVCLSSDVLATPSIQNSETPMMGGPTKMGSDANIEAGSVE